MILLSSIFATLLMTAFSYICGYFTRHQFREPELLNQLINTSLLPVNPRKRSWIGWVVHLIIGLLFAEILFLILRYTNLSPNLLFAVISGVVAGVFGIFGWQIMFTLNPSPPETHLNKFYLQLVIAHIIFSISFILFFVQFELIRL